MRKPYESLDEFVVDPDPEIHAEPPRPVSLRFTGEVEVLKPLAVWEPRKIQPANNGHWPLWLRRSLMVAGGGFAVIAFIFATAIFIGMYDQPAEPLVSQVGSAGETDETAFDSELNERQLPVEEPLASDIFTTSSSQPVDADIADPSELRIPNSALRIRKHRRPAFRAAARSRIQPASYQTTAEPNRTSLVVSTFVPTTLVIYIENGEIKTRIEPQVTSVTKKPHSLSN